MLEPVAGQVEVVPQLKKMLGFKNIPPGAVFRSPINGEVIFGLLSSGTRIADITSKEYDLVVSYTYPFEENYIGPQGAVEAGDVVVCATEKNLKN